MNWQPRTNRTSALLTATKVTLGATSSRELSLQKRCRIGGGRRSGIERQWSSAGMAVAVFHVGMTPKLRLAGISERWSDWLRILSASLWSGRALAGQWHPAAIGGQAGVASRVDWLCWPGIDASCCCAYKCALFCCAHDCFVLLRKGWLRQPADGAGVWLFMPQFEIWRLGETVPTTMPLVAAQHRLRQPVVPVVHG
jgi:hypothetical protein